MKRPPERWSIVIAAIAAAAGWRADICMIAVPSRTFLVCEPHQASGVEHVGAVGLRGPDRVEPEPVGLGDRLLDAGRRPGAPVAGVEPQLEVRSHQAGTLTARSTTGSLSAYPRAD